MRWAGRMTRARLEQAGKPGREKLAYLWILAARPASEPLLRADTRIGRPLCAPRSARVNLNGYAALQTGLQRRLLLAHRRARVSGGKIPDDSQASAGDRCGRTTRLRRPQAGDR